jgi:hypothetical protein
LETITMPHFAPLALAAALAAAPAFAPKALAQGGPYRVDDAAIAAPGTFKLEAYGSFSVNRSRERGYTVTPGATFEALPFVEFSLGIERAGDARGDDSGKLRFWSTVVSPQAKITLLSLQRDGIGLALKTGFSNRAALQRAEPDADAPQRFRRLDLPFATAIVSVAPIESMTVSANLGVEYDRTETRAAPLWGVGAAWEAIQSLSLIGAVSGSDRGRTALQAGLRKTVLDGRLDLDVVLGRNLSDERATWIIAAFAARF